MYTSSKRRNPIFLIASASAVALVATACSAPAGGDDPSGPASGGSEDQCASSDVLGLIDELDGKSPEERESLLAEKAAASEGGAIDLYTEINDPQPLVDAFQEKYDGLTLNVYRAGSDQIRQRVLEESAAEFSGADLVEMDSLEMAILDQEGLLSPASSTFQDQVSAAAQFDNFTGDRLSYIVPVWNTTLLPADQAPTSLEDLADARFKGKLALESSDVYWFAALVMDMEKAGKTEDEAVQVFRDIAANSAITSGHTTTTELVVAGQYAIAANNYVHRALELQGKDAPLGFLPIKVPVVAEITSVAVPCLSNNAAGALLLEDFILDPEGGQQLFIEDNRTPANEELAQSTLGGQDVSPIEVDVVGIATDYQKWSDLWDDVIRGGK